MYTSVTLFLIIKNVHKKCMDKLQNITICSNTVLYTVQCTVYPYKNYDTHKKYLNTVFRFSGDWTFFCSRRVRIQLKEDINYLHFRVWKDPAPNRFVVAKCSVRIRINLIRISVRWLSRIFLESFTFLNWQFSHFVFSSDISKLLCCWNRRPLPLYS